MALATKKCRVCGAQYEACRSAKTNAGIFRWQEVACSPECGAQYLKLITESRNMKQESVSDCEILECAPKDTPDEIVAALEIETEIEEDDELDTYYDYEEADEDEDK